MTANRTIGLLLALFGSIGGYALGQAQPPPPPAQEQPEVLTTGPVNEAFAEPVPTQAQAPLTIPNQPPAPVVETPPPDRPQGDQYTWIPGYWGWDVGRRDFVWTSACWRACPPNMRWMPGYWAPVADAAEAVRAGRDIGVGPIGVHVGGGVDVHIGEGFDIHVGHGGPGPVAAAGWEWIPGFWAPADAQEIQYLPAPPAPFDLAAPGAPPDVDSMWAPGCWYWQNNQYVRRPGYWMRQQADWVWEPSHYIWTPRGYIFVDGHWDYTLANRGVLFAPVWFPPSLYAAGGCSYSPTIAVALDMLMGNLFVCPRYDHYCFGDYYDNSYQQYGIFPQFQGVGNNTWYDPLYTHERWQYGRTDKQWEQNQQQQYNARRADKNLRPARTYSEMEAQAAKMPEAQRRNFELARPLATIAGSKDSPMKFEQMNAGARQSIVKQSTDVHNFRQQRGTWEGAGSTNAKTVTPAQTGGPPAVRNETTPQVEHRETTPPVVHNETAPPVEHREVTPPAVRNETAPPKETAAPAFVSPREVHVTQPEHVKLPAAAPVIRGGAAGGAAKGPPPRPAEEQKHEEAPKDTGEKGK